MRISAKAPTRIDLAGGTVDIWPLYLFLDHPVTLNLGIDLFAEADLETSASGEVVLGSEDQKFEGRFSWDQIVAKKIPDALHPALELHFKLLRHFGERRLAMGRKLEGGLKLKTRAKSPAGAGLGGSSALSIALIGALESWAQERALTEAAIQTHGESLIEIARDVETTVIQVPAGLQDYYGAMFGGLQSLRWAAGRHQRSKLDPEVLAQLQKRLMLFYSGQSRNSGINNWALFKQFVDKSGGVREQFAKISEATKHVEEALVAKNWRAAGSAIQAEWDTRRGLAPGISTPEIDQAFTDARKLTAVSGKVCGAGGGGCFFVYFPDDVDPALCSKVEAIFTGRGMRRLPFRATEQGLEVKFAVA